MRYIVEIDDQTTKGAQLVDFIEKLRAPKKAVTIRKEKRLTDEEMIMPGPRPSKAQLEEWLEPKNDEEERPLDEAMDAIKKKLKAKAQKKTNESPYKKAS